MWWERLGRLPGRSGIELSREVGEGLDDGGTCRPCSNHHILRRPCPGCMWPGWSFRPPFLPESFTPDHKPLMGEAPELRGFYLGCGFNSAGECEACHLAPLTPRATSGRVGVAPGGGWGRGGLQGGVRSY